MSDEVESLRAELAAEREKTTAARTEAECLAASCAAVTEQLEAEREKVRELEQALSAHLRTAKEIAQLEDEQYSAMLQQLVTTQFDNQKLREALEDDHAAQLVDAAIAAQEPKDD